MVTLAMNKKSFIPSAQMVSTALTVFKAMAFVQVIRPIVEGYQKKILDTYKFKIARKWTDRGRPCEIITDPKHSYLMSDDDFKFYIAECNEARKDANLHVKNEEFCPLLVAEGLLRLAETALCSVMEPITGISHEMATGNLDNYKKYIDLILKLLAPFVNPA